MNQGRLIPWSSTEPGQVSAVWMERNEKGRESEGKVKKRKI